jgi:hypothetical protein
MKITKTNETCSDVLLKIPTKKTVSPSHKDVLPSVAFKQDRSVLV